MARDGTRYEVALPLSQFSRLQELLLTPDGTLRAVMSFSQRKDHIVVSGRLGADFTLQCQRCLNSLIVRVDEPMELVFVDNELAASRLPEELDPVVLDEQGQIHVVDLFEDELILHVPTVPKHDEPAQCTSDHQASGSEQEAKSDSGSHWEFGELTDAEVTDKQRPFDVLKNLDLH